MEEDHRVCESVQSAAGAGGMQDYVLGRMEFLIPGFHQALDDALDGSFVAAGVSSVKDRPAEAREKLP